MRISGLSGSGLDIDSIVSETMEPYKQKVNNKQKELKLLELKQSMYQDIIESGQNFYEKYLKATSPNSLGNPSTYATLVFSSNNDAVSVEGLSSAEKDNYTVSVKQLAQTATKSFGPDTLKEGNTITLTVGDKTETFTLKGSDQSEIARNLNSDMSNKGFKVEAKYSDFTNNGEGGIKISSTTTGEESSFKLKVGDGEEETVKGKNAIVDITNGAGETKHYTGASNTVTLDNVKFTFNKVTIDSTTGYDNKADITCKNDISSLKETIVNFVNDYNKLIEDYNTKLSEKRDRSYMPLLEDEEKSMTESQVEAWYKKVKTGVFRNDTDLSRIVSSMKSAMQTMMSDTGLKLEDIGITPVNDYKTKNGTLKIDDKKLTDALENNLEGVKELFTSPEKTTTLPNGATYQSGGVITSLSSTFQTEFVLSSKSLLIQKAGTKSFSVSSTITKQISEQQKVIDNMNEALTTRENNLYTKYSKLETALSNLYSQQNWLMQQLG